MSENDGCLYAAELILAVTWRNNRSGQLLSLNRVLRTKNDTSTTKGAIQSKIFVIFSIVSDLCARRNLLDLLHFIQVYSLPNT